MPGSIIKGIKGFHCGWDDKPLGKSTSGKGHSHKELMKCAYRTMAELIQKTQELQQTHQEVKNLQQQLAKYLIKEEEKKEQTGMMDVDDKSLVDVDKKSLMTMDELKGEKQDASNLLEAESVVTDEKK